ncbi:MAG: NnrU family protein [Halieaceae bacterium]
MTLMLAGLALWVAIHLLPSAGLNLKQALVAKIGLLPYRAGFALVVLSAMALMVMGWRSAQPVSIYLPEPALRPLAIVLAAGAIVILCATGRATRIGRILRYPQLAGMLLWACAHLLANGDSRSLLLFGGFACWAVLEMFMISRREGPWEKKSPPSWTVELLGIALSLAVVGVIILIHPWLTGMPIF